MSRFCKKCGAEISDGAKFCKKCGAEIFRPQNPAQQQPPQPAAAPAGRKSGKVPMKILIPAAAAVLAAALGIVFLPRVLGGSDPFGKGSVTEQTIQPDQKAAVGNLSKTGWQLTLPANTFDKKTALTMKVLSKEEAEKSADEAFAFVGTPVRITTEGQKDETVWLGRSVTVTLQIPDGGSVSAENADDYLAAYYNGTDWEYIFPDITKIGSGQITFQTSHFTDYAAIRLKDDEEKIKLYANKMAAQTWEDEETNAALIDKLGDMFTETFEKMGITDKSMQGKLLRSIAKETDFGTLLVSAEQGDAAGYGVKCSEMAANALLKHLKLEDAFMKNITGKGAAIATGLTKGAIQIYDGNYENAAKELASAFIGYFPAGRAMQATVEIVDAGIASWKEYELDCAYRNYIKEAQSTGASSISDDDWATMCSTQLRDYLIRLQDEAKNEYCAVNHCTRAELDQDKTLSRKLADKAEQNLRKMFEKRLANEKEIREKETECLKIIEGFQTAGLLKRGSYGFDTGTNIIRTDVQDRLRSLFAVRKIILDMFGGEMPVLSLGESAEENLNEAIREWFRLGAKNRGEFYTWLEKKGYKSKVKFSGGGYAWVLVKTVNYDQKEKLEQYNKDTDAGKNVYRHEMTCSTGSYSGRSTYVGKSDSWYTPPMKHGETMAAKATISSPPELFYADQTITLKLSLALTDKNVSFFSWSYGAYAQFQPPEVQPGYVRAGYPGFVNAAGKSSFQLNKGSGWKSVGETVSASYRAGREEGEQIAIRTIFNGTYSIGTYYVYEWKQL
ncbi:MAG: zinc ribbon domain-containing protein [Clostridiales bacterium]|nr:zinc ribbon domain-containing protein [Clostridiales bacterium]